MKLLLPLLLLTSCTLQPAHAITPEMLASYASLGAATMTLDALEKRDINRACAHARHHLELATALERDTTGIRRTINSVCGGWQ